MAKQTRSDALEFAHKHGLTGISSTGGGDEPNVYTCNECGSSWKERDRYAWWPIRLRWAPSRLAKFFFGHWGSQIGWDGISQRVFARHIRVGPFVLTLGATKEAGR